VSPAPDLFEKVIGFRAWSIGRFSRHGFPQPPNDDLWSVGNHPVRWESATMTARCLKDRYGLGGIDHSDTVVPHVACKCGIYANHQLGWPSSAPEGMCIGAVAAWGRIQVHGRGFRSQHAQIVALGFVPAWSDAAIRSVRNVADRFGVPLVPLSGLDTVALEHGSPVPINMRPHGNDASAVITEHDLD
jgi:hypothetical protein